MQNKRSVSLLIILFMIASTADAQVEKVSLRVDGLACPFCAYGLEKKIKKLNGVGEITINVDQGLANISSEEKRSIEFNKLAEVVKDAGFTQKEMLITAVGKIKKRGGQTVLLVYGVDAEFVLSSSDEKPLREKTKAIRVTGRLTVTGAEENQYSLAVQKIGSI